MKMSKVNRCPTVDAPYCGYVGTVDMHEVLLLVVLYTDLDFRSSYTVDLTGLFCVCCVRASTLLQVTSGSPFQGGERRYFRRKSRLAFILWQWYFVAILCGVIQSSGSFSEKLKFLSLFQAGERQLPTRSHFWAQAERAHMLAKATVCAHTHTQIYFWGRDHSISCIH